jgi:hypothetical protein
MSDAAYEAKARHELDGWRKRMLKRPGPWDSATKNLQTRVNALIPEKVHAAITTVMEQMTRSILSGADFAAADPLLRGSLAEREARVKAAIEAYRNVAAVEGGVAGAGGFLLGAAEFPVLLSTKIKLLFDIAGLYGHDASAFRERLYILRIFELAFSSAPRRKDAFATLADWREDDPDAPTSFEGFDWRTFQQEYRDYIDLAKLAQLIPVVGAPVGVVVNWRLLEKLGETAINAYRLRWFAGAEPNARKAVIQP